MHLRHLLRLNRGDLEVILSVLEETKRQSEIEKLIWEEQVLVSSMSMV